MFDHALRDGRGVLLCARVKHNIIRSSCRLVIQSMHLFHCWFSSIDLMKTNVLGLYRQELKNHYNK